jgi:hypothetical protein
MASHFAQAIGAFARAASSLSEGRGGDLDHQQALPASRLVIEPA